MGIGDMLQAERDAEDAARYRWLKAQFELEIEKRERQELVSQKGNRTTYETHIEMWCIFRLKDDWRFGENRDDGAGVPEFDKLVDELRAQRTNCNETESHT